MRSLEFLDADYLSDPWKLYRDFRRERPVWWSERIRMFCVFRFEDVRAVLKDPRFTVEFPFRVSEQVFGRTLLDMDGPEHQRQRRLLVPLLSQENLEAFESEALHPTIEQLMAPLASERRFDFMSRVAERVPVLAICRFLGLPTTDEAWVRQQMTQLIAHLDDSKGKFAELKQAHERLKAWLSQKTERLESQGSSRPGFRRLIDEIGGEDSETKLSLYFLFLAAGIQTSVCLLGNAVVVLSRYPEWFEKLAKEPRRSRPILEEVLRLEPVQQDTVRFATEDVLLAGTRIRKGQAVKLMLASAGRDETVYSHPNQFDPERRPGRGLPFSVGTHACIGKRFALMEAELVLRELWRSCGPVELESSSSTTISGAAFRRPRELPVIASRTKLQRANNMTEVE